MLGSTPYAHEREGLECVFQSLPDSDPHHAWALGDLLDPGSGRLYEIDVLVLGRHALYLLELKAYTGTLEGDSVDWTWTTQDGRRVQMDNPLSSANLKAKVLASRLDRLLKHRPRVEALVVVTSPGLSLKLSVDGRLGVVNRTEITRALVHHEFPGSRSPGDGVFGTSALRDVKRAFETIGLRPRHRRRTAGAYELGDLLVDGPGYQDRVATHKEHVAIRRRARTYLVPEQTTVDRRQTLKRAADREARLLEELRDHRGILACLEYVSDAEPGPTVLFDAFEGGKRLDVYLAEHADLAFLSRVELIVQVGRALAHCHEKRLHHGAVSPEAVLVRDKPDGGRETRLFNFQLGEGEGVEGTVHRSSLAAELFAAYQAPELRSAARLQSDASDLFSLGALAYFVLTGKPPAASAAEMDERLARDGCLDPRTARDDVLPSVAELVRGATAHAKRERDDDVSAWVDLLEVEATAPDEATIAPIEELDPLTAREGQTLGGGAKALVMRRRLGHGASSVVHAVERDGRTFALKISDAPEHDGRLAAEATVLSRLSHARIVQLIDRVTLRGRPCLVLSFAGERTLHEELRGSGIVPLEFAQRYGDDLLSALEYLGELDILHRDIKPSNLVLGAGPAGKSAQRLTVIDFSLEGASLTDLSLGTSAYRDPFLPLRGRWDAQADLWSAALTLHEMLTGARPACQDPTDLETPLAIPAERFDAAVRSGLAQFFGRALSPRVDARFSDARSMRFAFARCFEAEAQAASKPGRRPEAGDAPAAVAYTDDELARISPETALEAVRLSSRAKNALDRAGLVRVKDLLRLADNRISGMRGVGKNVTEEILGLRDRWLALRPAGGEVEMPFFPGYRGDDLLLAVAAAGKLPSAAIALLVDAGLPSLGAIALAPAGNVITLAERLGLDLAALRALLAREQDLAGEREHPTTLEGWIHAVFPPRRKSLTHVRLYFGLDAPFAGRLDVTVRKVASHAGVTTAAVYTNLGKAREFWRGLPVLAELHQLCLRLFAPSGGAVPLARFADELLASLPHELASDGTSADQIRAAGASLARVLIEAASAERAAPFALARLGADGPPWLVASPAYVEPLRRMGEEADRLAARAVLPSPGEVQRTLAECVVGTPLESLPGDRLVQLGALASRIAACSGRLELYPRGLAARRALELSAGILHGPLKANEVRARIAARYPEAEPLPEGAELHVLLEPLGYTWNAATGGYERPGESQSATLQTSYAHGTRTPVGSAQSIQGTPESAMRKAEFDEVLAVARERGGFRALYITTNLSRRAALALGRAVGSPLVALDHELLLAMDEAARGKVASTRVEEAETRGSTGAAWPALRKLAVTGAELLLGRLVPPSAPLILVQPGLFVRYELRDALIRLVRHEPVPSCPILLLVPSHDVGGAPPINGVLALPGLMPHESAWIPSVWIAAHSPAAGAQALPAPA